MCVCVCVCVCDYCALQKTSKIHNEDILILKPALP